MDLDKIKDYLQTYLDDVITPDINRKLVGEEDEPITLTVNALRIGSYEPPIFHIFIDIDPNWKGSMLNKLEKNIEDFVKIFSISNKVKVHWNKRPLF
jgi:hypothetical protein